VRQVLPGVEDYGLSGVGDHPNEVTTCNGVTILCHRQTMARMSDKAVVSKGARDHHFSAWEGPVRAGRASK
jgi:hypothetical protein